VIERKLYLETSEKHLLSSPHALPAFSEVNREAGKLLAGIQSLRLNFNSKPFSCLLSPSLASQNSTFPSWGLGMRKVLRQTLKKDGEAR